MKLRCQFDRILPHPQGQRNRKIEGIDLQFIKRVTAASACSIAALAWAQEIPKPAIGPADKHDYICKVTNVNEDLNSRNLYGGRQFNFWTKTMAGGKFLALSTTEVRVASASKEIAATELFNFYRENAAKVRGDFQDRGQRPMSSIVLGCTDDPRSTREAKLSNVPLSNYKLLLRDRDHLYFYLSLSKDKVSDEKLFSYEHKRRLIPTDAFDRKDFFEAHRRRINKDLAGFKTGPFILEGSRSFAPYSFEKGGFDLGDVAADSSSYAYESDAQGDAVELPRYNLTASKNFSFYKPAFQEEAKKLERLRGQEDKFKWLTYVQPVSATSDGDHIEINGIITAIEIKNKKGETIIKMTAN